MPPTKLRQLLETLTAAAIGGATTSMADYLTAAHEPNMNHLWKVALVGAILGMGTLWTKRPIDRKKEEKEQ